MPSRHFGNICQFFIEHTDCGLLIAFKQSCCKKKKKSANNSCRKANQYLNDSLYWFKINFQLRDP